MVSTTRDAKELARLLAARAHALAAELFSHGQREGHEWRCGSLAGERGRSFAVHLTGPRAGVWADFGTGETGDALDLVPRACTAATRPKRWCGRGGGSGLAMRRRRRLGPRRPCRRRRRRTRKPNNDGVLRAECGWPHAPIWPGRRWRTTSPPAVSIWPSSRGNPARCAAISICSTASRADRGRRWWRRSSGRTAGTPQRIACGSRKMLVASRGRRRCAIRR